MFMIVLLTKQFFWSMRRNYSCSLQILGIWSIQAFMRKHEVFETSLSAIKKQVNSVRHRNWMSAFQIPMNTSNLREMKMSRPVTTWRRRQIDCPLRWRSHEQSSPPKILEEGNPTPLRFNFPLYQSRLFSRDKRWLPRDSRWWSNAMSELFQWHKFLFYFHLKLADYNKKEIVTYLKKINKLNKKGKLTNQNAWNLFSKISKSGNFFQLLALAHALYVFNILPYSDFRRRQ